MKLQRKQLTHATDIQLAAIGIVRQGNRGWLQKALAMDFTEEQVRLFTEARHAVKAGHQFVPVDFHSAQETDPDWPMKEHYEKLKAGKLIELHAERPLYGWPSELLFSIFWSADVNVTDSVAEMIHAEMNARGEGERVAV